MFECRHLLFNCCIFVWQVHILSMYWLINKYEDWCLGANIISWGRCNNFIHSCSFTSGYCNNLFRNTHFTIYQLWCFVNGNTETEIIYSSFYVNCNLVFKWLIWYTEVTNLLLFTTNAPKTHRQPQHTLQTPVLRSDSNSSISVTIQN